MTKTALILVDIQYDFIPPDGSLAVEGGDQILAPVYRILDEAVDHFDLIVVSQACLLNLRGIFLFETNCEALRTVCATDVVTSIFIFTIVERRPPSRACLVRLDTWEGALHDY